jgi:hypothetical protein
MRRYALRDDQWDRIKDVLPGREGHVGVTAKDNPQISGEARLRSPETQWAVRDLSERNTQLRMTKPAQPELSGHHAFQYIRGKAGRRLTPAKGCPRWLCHASDRS